MSLQERMMGFAMLGATWVMWLLCALSAVSLAVVLERTVALFRSRDDVARLSRDMQSLLRDRRFAEAAQRLTRSPSYEARIVGAGLAVARDGAASVQERMEAATETARLQMEARLAFLGTVGSNAPFIGLLGTVIGIIRAFHELVASQSQVSAGLMAEIGDALVATAIGLLVALPAVAFFNLFHRVVRARLSRARSLGAELLAHLKAEPAVATLSVVPSRAE